MSKITAMIQKRLDAGNKALVAYIVAGDPGPSVTVGLMHDMVAAGVDVIELGVPFSDPEAEGPVIQLAHERALAAGMTLQRTLAMVAEFRNQDQSTPIILMGYLNPIEKMGYESFADQASAAGVDGTIIVNLPPESSQLLDQYMRARDLDEVFLLSPTTTDKRAAYICEHSRGFVYYVSLKGTTGAGSLDVADVAEKMGRFRSMSKVPVLVGFGIKDGPSASSVGKLADGVVVGTAIVSLMEQHASDPVAMSASICELMAEIRGHLDALDA